MNEKKNTTTTEKSYKAKINLNEIETVLEKYYGLKGGSVKQLQGFDDANYHYLPKTKSNPYIQNLWPYGYVLKVMNSFDSMNNDLCEGQNALMLFLREHGIPCPVPVKTIRGVYYIKEMFPSDPNAKDIQEHTVRLLEYQPGIIFKDVPKSYFLFYQVGIFLGKLNEILKMFYHPVYDTHYSIWHLKSVPELTSLLGIVETARMKQLADLVIEKFKNVVLTRVKTFEKGMIHGDLNENNFLMTKTENDEWQVSAVLDFGDSHQSYYIFEVAVSLCYLMFECIRHNLNPVTGAGHFLAGYLTIRPNFPLDCNLLKFCICGRLCQTLILGLKASRLQPGNAYVLQSQDLGWPLLEELWQISENKITEEWESVIQLYNIKL